MEQLADRFATLSDLVRALVRAPPADETTDRPGIAPGERLGRFELLKEVGRGGHGVVYEARDLELGRRVAVKVLRWGGPRPDSRLDDHLLREGEAVASLHHPNIVTLHDLGRTEAGPYLVLELLQGECLARRLLRGPLPLKEAVRVGVDVASALVHAHARGVLHRDLKPGNVFVDAQGRAKVLDFGIASLLGRSEQRGSGTPGFMAPEQRDGGQEDERTDVHGLGRLVAQLLTGQGPAARPGEDWREDRPRLEGHGVPARLMALVSAALAEDPRDRPDAAAMLTGLLQVERDQQVRGSARRWLVRYGWLAGLALAGLLLVWLSSSQVIDFALRSPGEVLADRQIAGWAAAGLPAPEEVVFLSEGVVLRGWLFHHDSPAGCGVVLLHGKASTRHGMLRNAMAMWPRGCDLLLYDARNHGQSDRAPVTFGVHEKLDALAAVNLLAQASHLPRSRIGLFGSSLGASVALQAGVIDPGLAFVIADTPFADFRRAVQREGVMRYGPAAALVAPLAVSLAGWRGAFDPDEVSPIRQAHQLRLPVLLLHALADRRVPWQDSQELYDQLSTPRAELRVQAWASGHCQAEIDDVGRYRAEIDGFLDRQVPGFGWAAGQTAPAMEAEGEEEAEVAAPSPASGT
jgi:alpha-beta hydrolase superfamily lysophospholipase